MVLSLFWQNVVFEIKVVFNIKKRKKLNNSHIFKNCKNKFVSYDVDDIDDDDAMRMII